MYTRLSLGIDTGTGNNPKPHYDKGHESKDGRLGDLAGRIKTETRKRHEPATFRVGICKFGKENKTSLRFECELIWN